MNFKEEKTKNVSFLLSALSIEKESPGFKVSVINTGSLFSAPDDKNSNLKTQ